MSAEADKLWDDLAGHLRKKQGFCPLTPEEAGAAYRDASDEGLPDDFIQELVDSVTARGEAGWTPDQEDEWGDEEIPDAAAEGRYQIYRNEGEKTPETDKAEDDLRRKMLNDDDAAEDEP